VIASLGALFAALISEGELPARTALLVAACAVVGFIVGFSFRDPILVRVLRVLDWMS
jgi:hypothetical protein